MKYFLLKTDPQFDASPVIIDWFQKMDRRNIQLGKSHNIENFLLRAIQLQHFLMSFLFLLLWLQRN